MGKVNLCRGDTVVVIAGKDKNKSGKLLKIDTKKMRVMVEAINIIKKTQKPKKEGDRGSILELEAPIALSNVLLKCNKCNKGVRVGVKIAEEKKIRFCKKCGEAV